ncbi:hypothetical protein Tco_0185291 [Tanacetum coccineum]
MITILASTYPSSNNQLETLSNPMHQVAMPERQTLNCVDNSYNRVLMIWQEKGIDFGPRLNKLDASNPLDNALAYACMYTKQIQELLVYVSDTCPVLIEL